MAEITPDLRGVMKDEAYAQLHQHVAAVLDGVTDEIAAMATVACLIHHAFGHLWTGFYRVVAPGLLRVGPYQGTLGCMEIAFGKGVCGTAAVRQETVIVPNVQDFPGHITCDSRARSEIVVPVFGPERRLIGILDIDSDHLAAFDGVDRIELERLLRWFQHER
jgi:L-methionine (R)-S-oxide reductase